MEPSKKSDGIENAIHNLMSKSRRASIIENICVACGAEAEDFKNQVSRKEFSISGFCQKCQDDVYGE